MLKQMIKKEKNNRLNKFESFIVKLKICYKVFKSEKMIFVSMKELKDEKSTIGASVVILNIKNLEAAQVFTQLGQRAVENAAKQN